MTVTGSRRIQENIQMHVNRGPSFPTTNEDWIRQAIIVNHRMNNFKPLSLIGLDSYGQRPQLFLLYSLIIHSSMNFFHNTSASLYSLFPKSLRHEKLFFHSFNMQTVKNMTSEVICRCRSTYEGCDLVSLVISSIGDSELRGNYTFSRSLCKAFFKLL